MESIGTARKNIIFGLDLINKVKHLSNELDEDFSKFVREATEKRVSEIEQEKLELELAEGYAANVELDLKTCEDFKHIDSENI